MTGTRIALVGGIVLLALFFAVGLAATLHGGVAIVAVALAALVVLVAAGNVLYGRHSHGAAAVARARPAQEAHDAAADVAAEARRGVAAAARRGERYCPLDPAQRPHGPARSRRDP